MEVWQMHPVSERLYYEPVGSIARRVYRYVGKVRVRGVVSFPEKGEPRLLDETNRKASIVVVFPDGKNLPEEGEVVCVEGILDTSRRKPVLVAEHFDCAPEGRSVLEFKKSLVSPHLLNREMKLSGRVMNVREFGKTVFFDLQDIYGSLQVMFGRGQFRVKRGDIVGVEGYLTLSGVGEPTLKAVSIEILNECRKSVPRKVSAELGLKKPYLDIMINEDRRQALLTKFGIMKAIREFLERYGFVEVETPVINPVCSGANAKPFVVRVNALGKEMFLRPAPELYLKRLIIAGFPKIYEIGKNFRNEGIDRTHQPEFTMVEFYWAYQDYKGLMPFVENLFRYILKTVCGSLRVKIGNCDIDFSKPFRRIDFTKELSARTGHSVDELLNEESLFKIAKKVGIDTNGRTPAKILDMLAEKHLEEELIQPSFLIRHPKILSPLAKASEDDPRLTDRFELYVAGVEVANAYSELDDPEEQEIRFLEQLRARQKGDEEALGYDGDFVEALRYGMPPTAGCGIGIDRLAMLLSGADNIRKVIAFPM